MSAERKKARTGYDEKFLGNGIKVPLPKPGPEFKGDVLRNTKLRKNFIVDYIHYSVVMSKSKRQAIFTAANLDQGETKTVKGRNWFGDERIGSKHQILDKEGYKHNEWDRGHLTTRTTVAWGTKKLATLASNDSCSFANSCLQHKEFNQDEWTVPEEAVRHWKKDLNGKLCIITGPYFSEIDRWYTPKGKGRGKAVSIRIPSAFWKVVAYIDKDTGKLANQAYIMFQDDYFMSNERIGKSLDLKNYQVTITELERLTGLAFHDSIKESNPLFFHPRKGVNVGPEGYVAPTLNNLDSKVVFNRKDAETIGKARKRVIEEKETGKKTKTKRKSKSRSRSRTKTKTRSRTRSR
jgi:endonuclease G